MQRIFAMVRFVALLGVAASVLLSAGLYLTTAIRAFLMVAGSLGDLGRETTVKEFLIGGIELTDALLVATGLLIVAIGLYSLFIDRLDSLPRWLHIDSFEALKNKLVSVVVAALAVHFFSIVMEGTNGTELLPYGLAIAAVLFGLAAYSIASAWADLSRRSPEASSGDLRRVTSNAERVHASEQP